MKPFPLLLAAALLSGCGASWKQVGHLTMVSTRNFERHGDMVLLRRAVESQVRTGTGETLQQAIDNAVRTEHGGEYLANVAIWVRNDAEYMRLVGDVWGVRGQDSTALPPPPPGEVFTTSSGTFQVGQVVLVPWKGRATPATIRAGNARQALVELREGAEQRTTSVPWSDVSPRK